MISRTLYAISLDGAMTRKSSQYRMKFTFRTPLKKNNLIFLFIQLIANYIYTYALIIQRSKNVANNVLFFDTFLKLRLGFFERCGIQAKLIDFCEYVFTTGLINLIRW